MCGNSRFLDYNTSSQWYTVAAGGSPDVSISTRDPLIPRVNDHFLVDQEIDIEVTISAFHQGYYEFRLCNDPTYLSVILDTVSTDYDAKEVALYKCITADDNKTLLRRKVPLPPGSAANYVISTTQGPPVWTDLQLSTRWRQTPQDGVDLNKPFRSFPTYSLTYLLPAGVTCDHCILHMYWQTLNDWQGIHNLYTSHTIDLLIFMLVPAIISHQLIFLYVYISEQDATTTDTTSGNK
jgi:hypothetical protein